MKMKEMKKLLAGFSAFAMVFGTFSTVAVNVEYPTSMIASAEDGEIIVSNEEMYNDYLKLVVSNNGHYVLGTTNGDPLTTSDDNKKLLYGFPSEVGTTYTTIMIDGTAYHYAKDSLDSLPVYSITDKNNVSSTVYGDVYVKQTLSFVNNASTGREDVIEIKYEVTNNGTVAHEIGARIMLDTMLAGNDDAPFRIPGTGAVTTETEYTGENIPEYWQAFDNLENPKVVSQGSFLRDSENPPDKVQFTNWRNVYDQPWDYNIDEGHSNGDSAVSVIWNEVSLSPGETKTYRTYYGLSELTQDLQPPLAISVYGDTSVNVNRTRDTDFTFTAYVENIGEGEANNAYVNISLPDGVELVDNGSNERVRSFGTLSVNDVRQEAWTLRVHNTFSDGVFPIRVSCGADGIEEKTITRYVTFVKNNTNDNRILWGEEKKDFWGNKTGEWTGEDNLSFTNSPDNFTTYKWQWNAKVFSLIPPMAVVYPTIDKQDYYHISDEYFNILTDGMSNNVYDYIVEYRQSKWGGSCYGMSSVVALMKAGYLTPSYWQSGANVAHDLKKPKDSENIENLINFYHLSQCLPDIVDTIDNFFETQEDSSHLYYEADDSVMLEQLIDETKKVKTGGLPVSIGFGWKYRSDGREKTAGHAVIAYDVDDGSYTADGNNYRYRVSICDPNNTKWSYLYVADGYTSWYYADMSTVSGGANQVVRDGSGNEVKILRRVFSTPELLDIRNPQTGVDRTQLKDYNKLFINNYTGDSISISSDNKNAVVNGSFFEGDLQVHPVINYGIPADGAQNENNTVIVPDTGDVYIVTPEEENGEINSSMTYPNYRMSVHTTSGKSATFDPSGEVSLVGNQSDYEIKLSFNDNVGDLPWFSVTAYGTNANNTSLKQADEGMILTSDNLKESAIIAYNRNEQVGVAFSTDEPSVQIKAVNATTLGVYVDSDNDGIYDLLIADSNGTSTPEDETTAPTESVENPDSTESTTTKITTTENTTATTTSTTNKTQTVTQPVRNSGTVSSVSSLSNASSNTNNSSTNKNSSNSSSTSRVDTSPNTGEKGIGGTIIGLLASLSVLIATKKRRK